jgi:hypothetical protein
VVGAAGKFSYKLKFKPFKVIYTEQCSILGCNAMFTDCPRILRIEKTDKKLILIIKFGIFPPFFNLDFFQNELEWRENLLFLLSPKSTHGMLKLRPYHLTDRSVVGRLKWLNALSALSSVITSHYTSYCREFSSGQSMMMKSIH